MDDGVSNNPISGASNDADIYQLDGLYAGVFVPDIKFVSLIAKASLKEKSQTEKDETDVTNMPHELQNLLAEPDISPDDLSKPTQLETEDLNALPNIFATKLDSWFGYRSDQLRATDNDEPGHLSQAGTAESSDSAPQFSFKPNFILELSAFLGINRENHAIFDELHQQLVDSVANEAYQRPWGSIGYDPDVGLVLTASPMS